MSVETMSVVEEKKEGQKLIANLPYLIHAIERPQPHQAEAQQEQPKEEDPAIIWEDPAIVRGSRKILLMEGGISKISQE